MVLKKGDFDKILHFISSIQADRIDFRLSILNLLREVFEHQHLTFFLADEKGVFYNPTVINMNSTLMNDYEKHYYKTDIFHPVNSIQRLIKHNVLSVPDIMPYREYENTEYYNDLLKKYNLYYELAVPLKSNTRLLGGIGVLKTKEEGDFTPKEVYILDVLNKHISSNLNIYLSTLQLRYEKQVIQDSTHCLPLGVIILDDKFSPLFINETAQNFCGSLAEDLAITGSISNVVKTLLSKLSYQPFLSQSKFQTMVGQYSLKIVPFIAPSVINNITAYYTIYIAKISVSPSSPLDVISSFDLTDREKEVVKLILEGLNNNEIGKRLYISSNTVKTHILNIFKKLKVNRRTELIKKIHDVPAVVIRTPY